ncbi:ABC transporter ATP-binding protein [Sulfitobacter sp. F26204]|uniref:ABC transporter ATP-binding protein n=1 Tax=Sulfitobacter sp. F26204 TaxID=2996014 RepID=UPI00225E69A0|nr:ABC transporter ATP-binding protein [Sulfitobacter sp. F26204]MCX7558385.1 ABC transporter ATP-binding protein [Sulfitobacter sp. F26204]
MAQIEMKNVQKFFGQNQVLKDLHLTIENGEFVVMLGQSGGGKTTALRAIAGLETVTSGKILIDGKEVQDRKAADRDIAFVFQSFSLYPHMTVRENIAFPLRAVRMDAAERNRAVNETAETLQIAQHLDRKPSALSGGDMQRVAIGRALVRRPQALLMDEPLGVLDSKLREQMRAELKRLHIARGSTSVYVTHDQIEAMSLADRMVILHDGVLQQVGAPDEIYLKPSNLFVAKFVGSPVMNVVDVQIDGTRVALKGVETDFSFGEGMLAGLSKPGAGIALGLRPEAILLSHEKTKGYSEAVTTNIEPLGSHDIVDVRLGEAILRVRTASGFVGGEGQTVWVGLDTAQAHFFDNQTELNLRGAA